MSFHSFLSAAGGLFDTATPFGITFLVHSTVIIALGLIGKRLLKNKGSLAQSYLLRACVLAVFLSPLIQTVWVKTGTTVFFVDIGKYIYRKDIERTEVSSVSETSAQKPARYKLIRVVPITEEKIPDNGIQGLESNIETTEIPAATNKYENNSAGTLGITASRGKLSVGADKKYSPTPALKENNGKVESVANDFSFLKILSNYLLSVFMFAWVILSVFLVFRMIMIHFYIRHIISTAENANQELNSLCRRTAADMGLAAPKVIQSQLVNSAFLTGVVKPVIVVPLGNNRKLVGNRDVFVHELSHLAHHDNMWNLLCQLCLAIIPVQPLLWRLVRDIGQIEDYVCDDHVVRYSRDGYRYAERLLKIAKSFSPTFSEKYAGAGIFSLNSPLYERIDRILDNSLKRPSAVNLKDSVFIVAVFVCSLCLTGFVSIKNGKGMNEYSGNTPSYHKYIYTTVLNAIEKERLNRFRDDLSLEEADEGISIEYSGATNETILPPAEENNKNKSLLAQEHIGTNTVAFSGEQESLLSAGITGIDGSGFESSITSGPEDRSGSDIFSTVNIFSTASGFSEASIGGNTNRAGGLDGLGLGGVAKTVTSSITIPSNCTKLINITENFESLSSVEKTSRADYVSQVKVSQYSPVWSPDGSLICFTDQQYGIWVVPAEGGEPTLIFDNYSSAHKIMEKYGNFYGSMETFGFSPDGNSVLFQKLIVDEDRGTKITRTEVDNTITINVTGLIPIIFSVNLQTGETEKVIEDAIKGKYSGDGSYFGFIRWDDNKKSIEHNYELGVINQETGDTKYLTDSGCTINDYCFSGDSSEIIVSMKKEGETFSQLYRITIATGETEKITSYAKEINFSDITTESNWIRYIDSSISLGETVYLNIDNGKEERRQIPTLAKGAVYSPDNTEVCYLLTLPGTTVIIYNLYTAPVTDKPAFTENKTTQPAAFELKGNFPNPFNMSTTIEFTLPSDGSTDLKIYNTLGQNIRSLVSERLSAGTHRILWDGRDDKGNHVSSGVYLSSLSMGNHRTTKKMTLLK